jgi:hypothetical protein
MKNFRAFIHEDVTNTSTPDAEDRVRERQQREKEALKIRQNRERERAREQDFRKKAAERKAKDTKKNIERQAKQEDVDPNQEVNEYLEDGTDELVHTYKKNLPGQN